jgi:hypothetical protein
MKADPVVAFARRIASGQTRRRIVASLAASLTLAGSTNLLGLSEVDAGNNKKRRRRRRRKRRRQRRRDDNGQCVAITLPFEGSAGSCNASSECCDGGTCCTFNDVGGPESICIDLLTHTTACGLTCETVVNCFNSDQICVNGVCVDP